MQFAETFKRLRIKSGKSRYKLAQYSGLSEPYILRLESGERTNPSRDVVMMLGTALAQGVPSIEIWDIDALMLSADYAPLRRRGEGGSGAAPGAEAVAEPSAVFHVHPIQRREALASDRGRLAGDVHVVLRHEQRRVTQVLFQQEHVAAVEQKMGRIGMPQEMDVQPRDTGGLGQPSRKGADTVRSQRVPVYGQEEGIDAGMSGLGPEMVVVVEELSLIHISEPTRPY